MIGPARVPLFVPAGALVESSPYFKRLFNGPFKEAQTDEPIDLPDDDFGTWKLFLYWLHHDNLPFGLDLMDAKTGHDPGPSSAKFTVLEDLVKLWVFADKINQGQLEDRSIDALCYLLLYFWRKYESINNGLPQEIARDVIPATIFIGLLHHASGLPRLEELLLNTIALHVTRGVHKLSDYRSCFEDSEFSFRMSDTIVIRHTAVGSRSSGATAEKTFVGELYHHPYPVGPNPPISRGFVRKTEIC